MKWLHLSSDYYTCVDDEDYESVSYYCWSFSKNGYPKASINGKIIYLHVFLIGIKNDFDVDHINRAKWDNRKSNLRVVTKSENQANRGYPYNAPYPSEEDKSFARNEKNRIKKLISKRISSNMIGKSNESVKKIKCSNGKIYNSISQAAKDINGNASHIGKCCGGLRLQHKGLTWSFV